MKSQSDVKILIVDDTQSSLTVIKHILQKQGYVSIALATDGFEAVRLAEDTFFDLIFMDIQMPGMDGLTAIQQIRKKPGYVSIPIIAISAMDEDHYRQSCLEAGANDYIALPARPEEYIEKIECYLGAIFA